MIKIVVMSNTLERVNNPFVMSLVSDLKKIESDIFYFIHTAALAAEMFKDFDFIDNQINDNVWWFENPNDLDDYVSRIIKNKFSKDKKVLLSLEDARTYQNDVFYYQNGDEILFYDTCQVFKLNVPIVNSFDNLKVTVEYLRKRLGVNLIGYDELKVKLRECGFLYEINDQKHFLQYLKKYDIMEYLLFFYKDVFYYKTDVKYVLTGKYGNPYENILSIEKYFNSVEFNNIDLVKAKEFDLKFDYLPAVYTNNAFNSVTGRNYASSPEFSPLKSLQAEKRSILYASPDHYLIEFDYKSFEFDILCQIVGEELLEDPHTNTFDRLIDVDVPDKRKIGKNLNYSLLYGMNENRMADLVLNAIPGLPSNFREIFIEKLNDMPLFAKAKDFEKELFEDVRYNIIDNYYGRNIHLRKGYAILNNYTQSTAADFIYYKILCLNDFLDKDKIWLENHDSILIHMSEKSINSGLFEDVLAILKEPVGELYGRVEFKYGRNWGEMI